MERKCCSAPEQREKRNKTTSYSNSVDGTTVFKQFIMSRSRVSSSTFIPSIGTGHSFLQLELKCGLVS